MRSQPATSDPAVPAPGEAPRIAIAPRADRAMQEAVASGGGEVVSDPGAADGLIWTDPRYPERLKEILAEADPMWVQLPFAGIERFFEAGVIDAGRRWTCTKGTYGPACAEHALALMLAAARHLPDHIRAKSWRGGTFGQPERRLEGTTALIVGTGGIGAALVSMLEPLGVRTLAINRSGKHLQGTERTGTSEDLYSFAGEADHVVVAASLTPQTKGMFDSVAFEAMTEDAWLVNVARGGLVVTDDLVGAIVAGRIGGAALDVTDPEPLPDGHPLWELDNVIITPHVANTWDMAVPELLELVTRNVSHFAAGEPLEGVVDVDAGY